MRLQNTRWNVFTYQETEKNEPNYEPKFTCRGKTFNRTLRTMCHADRAKHVKVLWPSGKRVWI